MREVVGRSHANMLHLSPSQVPLSLSLSLLFSPRCGSFEDSYTGNWDVRGAMDDMDLFKQALMCKKVFSICTGLRASKTCSLSHELATAAVWLVVMLEVIVTEVLAMVVVTFFLGGVDPCACSKWFLSPLILVYAFPHSGTRHLNGFPDGSSVFLGICLCDCFE